MNKVRSPIVKDYGYLGNLSYIHRILRTTEFLLSCTYASEEYHKQPFEKMLLDIIIQSLGFQCGRMKIITKNQKFRLLENPTIDYHTDFPSRVAWNPRSTRKKKKCINDRDDFLNYDNTIGDLRIKIQLSNRLINFGGRRGQIDSFDIALVSNLHLALSTTLHTAQASGCSKTEAIADVLPEFFLSNSIFADAKEDSSIESVLPSSISDEYIADVNANSSFIFQPIVSIRDAMIAGFETLLRDGRSYPDHITIAGSHPGVIIKMIRLLARFDRDSIVNFDVMIVEKALNRINELAQENPLPNFININIDHSTLLDPTRRLEELLSYWKWRHITRHQINFELLEFTHIDASEKEEEAFWQQIAKSKMELNRMGHTFALDDSDRGLFIAADKAEEMNFSYYKINFESLKEKHVVHWHETYCSIIVEKLKSNKKKDIYENIRTLYNWGIVFCQAWEFSKGKENFIMKIEDLDGDIEGRLVHELVALHNQSKKK